MENCDFVTAPKEDANRILSQLLRSDAVRKDLKIRYTGEQVLIPVKQSNPLGRYTTSMGKFQKRELPVPPAEQVRMEMRMKGSNLKVPSKFIQFGKAIVFKESLMGDWSQELLKSTAERFGVDSIYIDYGIESSVRRAPSIRLIYGPGGDIIHQEGEVRYTFDPSRVMFSPGNVNVRLSKRDEDFNGRTVIDMFAGIGYFSLHVASGSKRSTVYACELNPVSFHYLEKNIAINSLENVIKPVLGDCRRLPPEVIGDHIIMGHFDCMDFMSNALYHSRKGTVIDFHLLLDTRSLGSGWSSIITSASKFGYSLDFLEQTLVKSYGPHMWHVVIKTIVTRTLV